MIYLKEALEKLNDKGVYFTPEKVIWSLLVKNPYYNTKEK